MSKLTGINERIVSGMWEMQAIHAPALAELGVQVVFRGVPSDAGGPDYQDAILSYGNKNIVHGDVEFHVRSSDWYRHGHHRDSNYDRVILHVVWQEDESPTLRADGTPVATLALGPTAAGAIPVVSQRDRRENSVLLTHPCVATFAGLSRQELDCGIRELARERFRGKVERFRADLPVLGADQVAYQALLEALGYASNREAFRMLSEVVPYAWLRSIPEAEFAATLLSAASLGPGSAIPPPAHLPPEVWRLARLRPANHPVARLRGLSVLLQRFQPTLARALENAVQQAPKATALGKLVTVVENGQSLIGRGRADEIVVSVVLPLVQSLGESDPGARDAFETYRSPPQNRWTRVMLDLTAQAGHSIKVRTAADHQGLHFLYHTYCRAQQHRRCPLCLKVATLSSG